ncbi:hypothetical protein [Amycolatopsis taiwanensis]|uniref:hypothetical protein n=1 Tax=Amycolatopsis taiwanensis TaxID=342230 RepID=UPI0012EC0EDD|nr:hypothetical protein [Amycolatopsis taiwanensis]
MDVTLATLMGEDQHPGLVINPGQQKTPCRQGVFCTAVSTRRAPEGIRTPNLLIGIRGSGRFSSLAESARDLREYLSLSIMFLGCFSAFCVGKVWLILAPAGIGSSLARVACGVWPAAHPRLVTVGSAGA